MRLSACIEWLFAAEAPEFADRVRLAHRAGLDAVEFWLWSNKDIDAIATALDETGLPLAGMVAEPMVPLTDPARHGEFLEGLRRSIDVARRLRAPVLIAQTGDDLPGHDRAEQRAALVEGLGKAAPILAGSGVVLAIEPLNTLVDHVGYFLPSTAEGLDIVDEVGRPEIGLIYDIYHSAVMSEDIAAVLAGRVDRIAHAHLADAPGRHEPGSGALDWRQRVDWLMDNGYAGLIGLEYRPTGTTVDSLRAVLGAR
ncbi:TIM barrel protein [Kaistia dalseonensis]|uniref:Hydroxypyruvate isomerase n=1 Tax=Kaistia dalseonensis TaxID=410840 RepID=A0ABU0HAD0_9HYPH|nr:TIM barrel protein [Kaistia dalseonensis]MCX5496646.1 TIM barrel protein [Kaistia dalseonensis]MDQ0439269.1 hydroxypyruvate isomerase [Kaistia dalseonensis]